MQRNEFNSAVLSALKNFLISEIDSDDVAFAFALCC